MLYKGDAATGKNGGNAAGDQALYTSTNKRKNLGSGDKTIKCSWCGNKGHMESECNKKKNGVPRKKQKTSDGATEGSGGALFKKGSTTASGSGGGDKDNSNIECWICKQMGHYRA